MTGSAVFNAHGGFFRGMPALLDDRRRRFFVGGRIVWVHPIQEAYAGDGSRRLMIMGVSIHPGAHGREGANYDIASPEELRAVLAQKDARRDIDEWDDAAIFPVDTAVAYQWLARKDSGVTVKWDVPE